MAFVPVFQEVADTLLFDNIMAIVAADMKPALDYYFPLPQNLPDFAQKVLGNTYKLGDYPVFALDPDEHGPQQSADGSFVESSVKVQAYMSTFADNVPDAVRLAAKYVTAFKAIMRKADRVKPYTTGSFTLGFPAGSVLNLSLEIGYKYGVPAKATDGFEMPVNFELTFKFNER
jgi:hypothetical protein